MRKIHTNDSVRHFVLPTFNPSLVRTANFLVEAKAILFQEISHIVIIPIV